MEAQLFGRPVTIVVEIEGQVVGVIEIKPAGGLNRSIDAHYHSSTSIMEIAHAMHEAAQGLDFLVWKEFKVLPVPIDFDGDALADSELDFPF